MKLLRTEQMFLTMRLEQNGCFTSVSTCCHSLFLHVFAKHCNFEIAHPHLSPRLSVYQSQPCHFSFLVFSVSQFLPSESLSPSMLSIYPSIFIFLSAISVHLFSATSWWSAAFIISKCHLDISSWGQAGCCKWGMMEEGGLGRGTGREIQQSLSSWPLRDFEIWLQL